jgi:hypothetical protein
MKPTRKELVTALKDLYQHCGMIHTHWGENSNWKEAKSAIENGQALLSR